MRRIASSLALGLLLLSFFAFIFTIQPAKAQTGTIYIRADGSIDPLGSPILTSDNQTYWLTANASSSIVIERDNIIFHGQGYKVQGAGNGTGIYATQRTNVTITDVKVTGFDYGIWLEQSSGCSIIRNNVTGVNWMGITLYNSSENIVSANSVTNDDSGIWIAGSLSTSSVRNLVSNNGISYNSGYGLYVDHESHENVFLGNEIANNNANNWTAGIYMAPYSVNDTFVANNIINNSIGIYVNNCHNNTLFHNNFIDNVVNVAVYGDIGNTQNTWDASYPSGGNYWSDYSSVDQKSGPYQNITGSDGISDTSYLIDAYNTDRYPLMAPFHMFDVGVWNGTSYSVNMVSNSTITNLNFNPYATPHPTLSFNVTGTNGTVGFCRIAVPTGFMWVDNPPDGWVVRVGGTLYSNQTIITYGNYTYIYFTYTHTTKTVQIQSTSAVPEFQQYLILPLLMTMTLLAALGLKKRRNRLEKTRA